MAHRQRSREWRALGALLVAPGVLCTTSLVTGGATDPLVASSNAGAAIAAATGLLGVLSLLFGGLLLLAGRCRRSASVLVLAWAGLLAVEQALFGAMICPSYLWLPQLSWLAFLGLGSWRSGTGRRNPAVTRLDTGWQLLGLALVVPGLWFGRSILFMRIAGEPWAADGTVDLAWWLVQAAAAPALVAGARTLVTAGGRPLASAVALGMAAVAGVLLALVPDQGVAVTLVVPGAWLAVVVVGEGAVRIGIARRRAHAGRVADDRRHAGAPARRTALTGVALFVGAFAATMVVVAVAVH